MKTAVSRHSGSACSRFSVSTMKVCSARGEEYVAEVVLVIRLVGVADRRHRR